MWDAGDHLGINGLKVAAADKFKVALSQFNIYGAEMNFSFLFFEGLVKDVEAVWDELVWRSNRILLGQLSMHIQSNIKEWADKKGAQARFVESSYRLTFREIQQQPRCSESMLQVIRAKYQDYLEAETGHAALQH